MSEDRLEKALEAMKNESAAPERLAEARTRVWEKLVNPALAACVEFQPDFGNYLAGRLGANRQLLIEDHLSRCAHCRARLAELKGERKVSVMPQRRFSWRPRIAAWAVAAALLVMALYLGRDRIDTLLAPGGPRATVISVSGMLHRLPEGLLQTGASFGESEVIRTAPGSQAMLRLADGSAVELNERTELFVRAKWSGQTIFLQRGDIIVQAAKQRRGHLRVQTRDSIASVKGTVFAVSAGFAGTVVSVVEGAVAVARPGNEVILSPGEQAASNPALTSSVQDAISWSPEAESYYTLLASISKIERQIAALPGSALRTQPRLLQYLPPNAVVYGAVPNLGGTITQAMALAERQSADNPVFGQWWNSTTGQELRQVIDRIQAVTPMLGEEIIYVFASGAPELTGQVPLVMTEVQPGKQTELAGALDALSTQAGQFPLPYSLTDSLLVLSDSLAHLQWGLRHLGEGASSSFAAAIASRYQRGAGWLLGVDMESAVTTAAGTAEAAIFGVQQLKHLFIEQRGVQGIEENEVSLTFKGPRMGMASWLADAGSGGAAEYISADTVFAFYVATREPRQLYEELTTQLAKLDPAFGAELAEAQAKLGVSFSNDLAAVFGTESAFSLEGLSLSGPVWTLAALVNNPSGIDATIRKIVDFVNASLAPEDQAKRIFVEQQTADERTWTTMRSGAAPFAVTWTYDRGYLVAASDRAAALRAIANRNGGLPLVWSSVFQQQLPSSAGLHPSGFAWLNTKGALQGLAAFAQNSTLQQLVAERDPILVVFNGTAEQIHSASRTPITGLVMDMMLMQSLGESGIFQQRSPQPGIR